MVHGPFPRCWYARRVCSLGRHGSRQGRDPGSLAKHASGSGLRGVRPPKAVGGLMVHGVRRCAGTREESARPRPPPWKVRKTQHAIRGNCSSQSCPCLASDEKAENERGACYLNTMFDTDEVMHREGSSSTACVNASPPIVTSWKNQRWIGALSLPRKDSFQPKVCGCRCCT